MAANMTGSAQQELNSIVDFAAYLSPHDERVHWGN